MHKLIIQLQRDMTLNLSLKGFLVDIKLVPLFFYFLLQLLLLKLRLSLDPLKLLPIDGIRF